MQCFRVMPGYGQQAQGGTAGSARAVFPQNGGDCRDIEQHGELGLRAVKAEASSTADLFGRETIRAPFMEYRRTPESHCPGACCGWGYGRLHDQKVLGRGSRHGGSGDSLVEGDKAAAFLHGKREEVNVGEGFGREDAAMVEPGGIED